MRKVNTYSDIDTEAFLLDENDYYIDEFSHLDIGDEGYLPSINGMTVPVLNRFIFEKKNDKKKRLKF
jgi:hypothetical protein